MSSWSSYGGRNSYWQPHSWWHQDSQQGNYRGKGGRRQREVARQMAIDAEVAKLTQGLAIAPPTFAQIVQAPPPGAHDGSEQAQDARKQAAGRIRSLVAARDALAIGDPCRKGIEDAIAQARAQNPSSGNSAPSPGQALDQAVLRTAELRVKTNTAHSQLQKAQEHFDQTKAELEAAELGLATIRSRTAGATAAAPVGDDQTTSKLLAVRQELDQLKASGFHIPPGQETLGLVLDRLWEMSGPPPATCCFQAPPDPHISWSEEADQYMQEPDDAEAEEEDEEVSDEQIREALASMPKATRRRLVRKSCVKVSAAVLKASSRSDA